MHDTPWKEAASIVLGKSVQSLHYKTIAEEIEKQKLRKTLGATPANTVFVVINNSIKNEGDESPFIKTSPGMFMLRSVTVGTPAVQEPLETVELEVEERPVVKCVGMYWNANKVSWKTRPKILGQQQQGSKEIDFCEQIGIYLLYDRSRVIYVGRSVDRPLGQRLAEHTKDRLNGRWDRFSWFGLRGVDETGKLTEPDFNATQGQIIGLMEAILIEALEPPQNRKRGDDFSEIEYLQADDKEISSKKNKAMLELFKQQLGMED
ncbi:HTH domain-containing protein [Cypionkella sinensis]|uniref:HTH domain-containing protein n=1 Tax=Cypionkella sinensis TaxID=1756043 RepID=A0ABV7J1P4_9RHOB